MDMKIKGYVRAHHFEHAAEGPDSMLLTKYKCGGEGYDRAATLIPHPGPEHEEVFTASEVAAMFRELRDDEVPTVCERHNIPL